MNKKTVGLLVEPVPHNYNALSKNLEKFSDRYMSINSAIVANEEGSQQFYTIIQDRVLAEFPEAPSWFLTELGSFNRAHVEKHFGKKYIRWMNWKPKEDPSYYIGATTVKTMTPKAALNLLNSRFPACSTGLQFLNVDAEGLDWTITKSFLDSYTPSVVIFEHTHLDQNATSEAARYLRELGYFSWPQGTNTYSLLVDSLNE